MSNSNPHNNDTLYRWYRDRFGDRDEFLFYGWHRIKVGKLVEESPHVTEQPRDLQRHHLWSMGRRPDLRSNLLIVPEVVHRWCHAHPQEGRVVCVLAKLRKMERLQDPEEFTLDEINLAAGKEHGGSIVGIIESYEFEAEQMRRLQGLCLNRLYELERSVKCGE